MSLRVAILGAGSARFTRKLVGDLLLYPELRDVSVALHDIDADRLRTATAIVERIAVSTGATPRVDASLDRRAAIKGSQFVINTIQVGGLDAARLDFQVPAKFGLQYAINDTINVGGVMRALRTAPVMLAILRDMEQVAPDAYLLNYTNPMSILVSLVSSMSPIQVVGLCHSVDNTVKRLAGYLQIPPQEIEYRSAGVNHLAFVLELTRKAIDLYPALHQFVSEGLVPRDDLVRAELFRRLGYYPTESSEHHSDYSPWFTAKGLIDQYNIPIDDLLGRDERGAREYRELKQQLDEGLELPVEPSNEYAAVVVRSIVTGAPSRIIGNVMNHGGLVANLPPTCCVEVPTYVDSFGVHPIASGELPAQCVAYMNPAITTQTTTVAALVNEDRDYVYHAVAQDPMVQTRLTLDQVWQLTDQLLEAQRAWLPGWLGGEA